MKIEFEIPELPKTMNSLLRQHWAVVKKEKDRWRNLVRLYLKQPIPKTPFTKAEVTCTRYSSREPDVDNLYSGFKFVIDSLTSLGIILDDKPSVINLNCVWVKASPKQGKIKVEVLELESLQHKVL